MGTLKTEEEMKDHCNFCGNEIAERKLELVWDAIEYFFCSKECKKKYVRRRFLMVV